MRRVITRRSCMNSFISSSASCRNTPAQVKFYTSQLVFWSFSWFTCRLPASFVHADPCVVQVQGGAPPPPHPLRLHPGRRSGGFHPRHRQVSPNKKGNASGQTWTETTFQTLCLGEVVVYRLYFALRSASARYFCLSGTLRFIRSASADADVVGDGYRLLFSDLFKIL